MAQFTSDGLSLAYDDFGPRDARKAVVLVHGFWVTPRSWEHWADRYQRAGYQVIAPAYPGFEVEVEALNADPSPIEEVTAPAIIEHLESVLRQLDEPPIIIGHSAGGAFTQVLLDRGFGAAGVALNSAPTEGVRVTPLSLTAEQKHSINDPMEMEKAADELPIEQVAKRWIVASDPDERARRQDRVQRTEAAMHPIAFDANAARAYGRIYAAVASAGRKPRGARAVDLMIAATALAEGVPLFTRNPRDFAALAKLVEVVEV